MTLVDVAGSRFDKLDEVLGNRAADPLDVLREATKYQRYLTAIEGKAVKTARSQGRTWEEIANAVGSSRQAVWKRWRTRRPGDSLVHGRTAEANG